jgi:hypothetical protein
VNKATEKAGGDVDVAMRRLDMIISADRSLISASVDARNYDFYDEIAIQAMNVRPKLARDTDGLMKATLGKTTKLYNQIEKHSGSDEKPTSNQYIVMELLLNGAIALRSFKMEARDALQDLLTKGWVTAYDKKLEDEKYIRLTELGMFLALSGRLHGH